MQTHSQNIISFKAISLNSYEKKRTDNLLRSMDNPFQKEQARLELFDIFDKHLQKEAKNKSSVFYYQEDFLQRLYLSFLENIEKTNVITTEKLLEILNTTKPNSEEIKEERRFWIKSLEKKLNSQNEKTIDSILSEEKVLKPLSFTSQEERTEQLKKIKKLTNTLSEKEQYILNQRAGGKKYKDIANELELSNTNIELKKKSAIAKIQLNNNLLSKEYDQFANDFIKTFDLRLSKNDVINFIINNIEIINYDIKTLDDNIEKASKLLELDRKVFIEAALKQSSLFYQKPETIYNNVKKTSKLLEIDKKLFISAALKQPQLFYQTPETIFNNIKTTSKLLKINRKTYTVAALKQPQLFYQKPETIFENIKTASKMLEVDIKLYTSAALKQASLFYQKPETIYNNVEKASKLLGIDKKTFIEAALKQPQLFYLKPESIAKKVNIIKYYKQIQNKNSNKITFYVNSDKRLYYDILAYLIKSNDGLSKALKQNEAAEYLKSQNKIYNFTIPQNELAEEFTKYVQDFSRANIGKQIFKITIKE